jgi:hypothetical protein
MKVLSFEVSDETYDLIQQMDERKLKGRAWLEKRDGKKQRRFELYQHNSTKCTKHIIHEAPFGSLYQTVENILVKLSFPKRVGLHRVADLLMDDAKESADALHQMADSELKDEPLNPKKDVKI